MFKRIREIWQTFKAWRRGERRIAPYGSRGRIYVQKDAPSTSAMSVERKTVYKTLAKVIRADGRPDEHYNLSADMKLSSDTFDTLKGGKTHG